MRLTYGAHESADEGVCLMEAVAYLAGEPHTDHPACACPVLTAYGVRLNDAMGEGPVGDHLRDRYLRDLAALLVGTRADPETQRRRAYVLADGAVRAIAPMALDAAGLADSATRLRSLPPVVCAATAAEAAAAAAAAAKAADAAAAWADAWAAAAAAKAAKAAADAAKAAAAKAAWAAADAAAAAKAADAAAAAKAAWAAAADGRAAWAAADAAAAAKAAWAAAADAAKAAWAAAGAADGAVWAEARALFLRAIGTP